MKEQTMKVLSTLNCGVFLVLMGLLLPVVTGCGRSIEKELPGVYVAKLPAGEAILKLLPGGECVQDIRLKDGKNYSARGRWSFDKEQSYLSLEGTRIALDGFGRMNPDIAEIKVGGTGDYPVRRGLFGGIQIGLGESVAYHKQKKK